MTFYGEDGRCPAGHVQVFSNMTLQTIFLDVWGLKQVNDSKYRPSSSSYGLREYQFFMDELIVGLMEFAYTLPNDILRPSAENNGCGCEECTTLTVELKELLAEDARLKEQLEKEKKKKEEGMKRKKDEAERKAKEQIKKEKLREKKAAVKEKKEEETKEAKKKKQEEKKKKQKEKEMKKRDITKKKDERIEQKRKREEEEIQENQKRQKKMEIEKHLCAKCGELKQKGLFPCDTCKKEYCGGCVNLIGKGVKKAREECWKCERCQSLSTSRRSRKITPNCRQNSLDPEK